MNSFTDTNGKTWPVEITFGGLKRVRAATGVDLGKPFDGKPSNLERLADPESFVDALYALIAGDADPEQFARALIGPPFAEAEKAFWAAYQNFFRLTNRNQFAELIGKSREVQTLARAAATEEINAIDPAAEAEKVRRKIAAARGPGAAVGSTVGGSGGNSRQSPATLAPILTD